VIVDSVGGEEPSTVSMAEMGVMGAMIIRRVGKAEVYFTR